MTPAIDTLTAACSLIALVLILATALILAGRLRITVNVGQPRQQKPASPARNRL